MSKKKQHHVPKFYLRYFSFEKNEKEIGIFNLENNFFKNNVAIRDQGSKKYFYGKDEVIENYLSKLEGDFAYTINNILEKEDIDKTNKKELYDLLTFIVFTDLRSTTSIDNLKEMPSKVNALGIDLIFPEISHEKSVAIMLSTFENILPAVLDLDYKLLKNSSKIPFITSDYPISKYNLLYERIPTYFSVCGFKSKGLLIFLPINPSLCVVFYDNSTYKIGNKKDNCICIDNEKEVNQLNVLQFLNGKETLFFNESVNLKYILELKKISEKYQKPNKQLTSLANFKRSDIVEKKKLIINRYSNTVINLKIHSLKIHSGTNYKNIDPTRITLRNK